MHYPETRDLTSLYSLSGNIKDYNRLVLTVEELHAYVDADRAQRAAPGVQEGEVRFRGRCEKHLSPEPCAACAQPPQQSAQPVAWMHETPGRVDVIHDEVKKLLSAVATDYLYRPIDKSEKYTIPLYAAAQPVEVQRVPLTDEFLRANGVMVHGDGNVFFTNVQQLNRVLGIKPTSSEGGA